MRIASLFSFLLIVFTNSLAQEIREDTLSHKEPDRPELLVDSARAKGKRKVINIDTYAQRFDPRKALFYSAVLPGLGQAYNKKYWKIPLIYGGFWGLLAVVNYYNQQETKYTNQLFQIINYPDKPLYPGIITNPEVEKQLRTTVDYARRQRDYFMIFTGFFYILQMVDAHVDAHLKEFDLNPKLQVRLEPFFSPAQGIGLGATIRF